MIDAALTLITHPFPAFLLVALLGAIGSDKCASLAAARRQHPSKRGAL